MRKKTLLLVRPQQDRDLLVAELQRQGALVRQLPVMGIAPLASEPATGQINLPERIDVALFVSRNAVRFGLPLLQRRVPAQIPAIQFFAVGETTAQALRDYHLNSRVQLDPLAPGANYTSEGLLALPQLQQVTGKSLVIFRGEGGRTLLQQELARRGAIVECCEVYRRERCDLHKQQIQDMLAAGGADMVVIHSGELLGHLLALAGAQQGALLELPVLVPGERVAQRAGEAGFKRIVKSRSAVAGDMVSALRRWYSNP